MKKSAFKILGLLVFITVMSLSCTSDDREYIAPLPEGDYSQGVFVLNEGGYGYSNASVSFLDANAQVYNSIFSGVNTMPLGDVAQSMGIYVDNAYVVVNSSSTIEVVNRYTFEHITTVTDKISSPRYIAFEGGKGYITNWGDPNNATDDYIAVLDLTTHIVETKIAVAEGPEKIVINNGKIYVAHKGGYNWGNTVSVIDATTQNVTESILVDDLPSDLLITNEKLYVLCSGKPNYAVNETSGALFKINIMDNTIEKVLTFPEGQHPTYLDISSSTLYYTLNNAVYTVDSNTFEWPEAPLFSPSTDGATLIYGFKINKNNIYIADAKDYVSNGEVFVYSLDGLLASQFSVQIIPNSFYFNN